MVSNLVVATGLSQPLISQQLRLLRGLDPVTVVRPGREAHYSLADNDVAHVIRDEITHTQDGPGREASA